VNMALDDFIHLVSSGSLPKLLDIAQMAPAWSGEQGWMDVRDELDALIFSQLMQGEDLTVRRIVFLEPPRDATRSATEEHRRWIGGLVRDLYALDMPEKGEGAAYRIRQVIRAPHSPAPPPLEDGWNSSGNESWARAFEDTWVTPGCIENNLVPADFPDGPAGDRDARWYLWN
jgi:hypothetical protein